MSGAARPPLLGGVHRLSAFTTERTGGNPAGVWIGNEFPSDDEMLAAAKAVGYSETAFIAPSAGPVRSVRYFSPECEVPFCGHATIASGVHLGNTEGHGHYLFRTRAGDVEVDVIADGGSTIASLTSVEPRHEPAPDDLVDEVLAALEWSREDLDPSHYPVRAFAGAWHLVLVTRSRSRLARLEYDFDRLRSVMEQDGLATLQLVWFESEHRVHARNPFPVGGIYEDPATGAAAAALGGYLRDTGRVDPPASFTVVQGVDMGRRSVLEVHVPASGGIQVSGTAIAIDADPDHS